MAAKFAITNANKVEILNGKHGFLCGHLGNGIYVENAIG